MRICQGQTLDMSRIAHILLTFLFFPRLWLVNIPYIVIDLFQEYLGDILHKLVEKES